MVLRLSIVGGFVGSMALGLSGMATVMPADLEMYEWRSSISGSFETGRIYRARLSPEVFDGFRSFPLDLRVVDRDGVDWPGLVWSRSDRSGVVPVRHTLLTRIDTTVGPGFTVKEFQIEPGRDGLVPLHNRVIVQAGSSEQVRRVEVWGGPNHDKLVLLGSGFVVEQKSPATVRNRAIDYPDSSWPLVVVRVFNDMHHPEAELDWRSTEIVRVDRDDADHELVDLKRMEAPVDDPAVDGVATMYLDAGSKNRPLLYMTFASDATEFAIPVRVFGRNDVTNKWRWVADGGIHQLEGTEQNRISLAKSDYRYYKVEFHYHTQKLPKISHVAAAGMPFYLLFEAKSETKPYLFFGAPRYDLDMVHPLRRVDAGNLPVEEEATLSKRHTNPMRVASTLSDYRNTLMRFGLGVVVLLVVIFALRLIRRRYF